MNIDQQVNMKIMAVVFGLTRSAGRLSSFCKKIVIVVFYCPFASNNANQFPSN